MSGTEIPAPSLDERVQRLERSNRRLFGLVVLLVLTAFLQTYWHFLPTPGVVVARRFQLKDRVDRIRGEWSAWDDGTPAFRLNDSLGQARALFTLRQNGVLSFKLTDPSFTNRLELLVGPEGNPRVALGGQDGRTRAHLWVDETGTGRLEFPNR